MAERLSLALDICLPNFTLPLGDNLQSDEKSTQLAAQLAAEKTRAALLEAQVKAFEDKSTQDEAKVALLTSQLAAAGAREAAQAEAVQAKTEGWRKQRHEMVAQVHDYRSNLVLPTQSVGLGTCTVYV